MKIFDASSIICILREINFPKALDICVKRGYQISITQQVFNEIKRNPETYREFVKYGKISIIPVTDDTCFRKLSKRYPWLHSGEISVICLGCRKEREFARYFCIIDEPARKLKDKLGIQIHGTVGLLLWQKERQEISSYECDDLYSRFKESSFRITDDIFRGLIQ